MSSSKKKISIILLSIIATLSMVFLCLGGVGQASAVADRAVIVYDFSDPATISRLKPYFQAGGSSTDRGVPESLSDHWSVGADGELNRINDLGGDMAATYAEVYFDRQFTNFEMNFHLKLSTNVGWSGIMFNKSDMTSTMYAEGDSLFFNSWSSAFFHGQTIGENSAQGNSASFGEGFNFKTGDWNAVKVRVFGTAESRTVEVMFNGIKLLESIKPVATVKSNVCLFTTSATAGFKNVTFRCLNETGEFDDNPVYYDLTDENTLGLLEPYFQAGGLDTDRGVKEDLNAHWTVSDGELKRINDLGGSMSATYAELYFEKVFKNFEMRFELSAPTTNMGWSGVMFGKQDKTATMYADGDSVFVNPLMGKFFFHGQTIGTNDEEGNSALLDGTKYYPNSWNSVVLKVYGDAESRTAQLWVNGNKVLNSVRETTSVEGSVCLFTTSAETSFRNIEFHYLDESGKYVGVVPATAVELSAVETEATVGEETTLHATITPANSTMRGLVYSSSSNEIATVSADGVVRFLSQGEVTITVRVKDAPEVTDSVTFIVSEEAVDPVLVIKNKITEATAGDELDLILELTPSDDNATYTYTSDSNDVAKVNANGRVNFIKAGTVTITATLSGSTVYDSMTVNVLAKTYDKNAIYYDFADEGTVGGLRTFYQETATSGTGVEKSFSEYWAVNEYGVLSRINDLGGGMDAHYAMMYFDRQFRNFEISYKMRASNAVAGWVGVMFGKSAYSTTMFGDGDSVFFNVNDGGAFLHGQKVGANNDAGNSVIMDNTKYFPGQWNDVRVKVYGSSGDNLSQTVELYVNGTKLLSNEKAVAPVRGKVCLFTTAVSADFKDVSFKFLNEEGDYTSYIPAESVSLGNVKENVYMGDSVTLSAQVSPENSTTRELVFASSDLSVAIVNEAGVVTFINKGQVTITVSVKDVPEITDSVTFNVAEKLSKIEISNKITEAIEGDSFTLSVNVVPGDYLTGLIYTSSDTDIATVSENGVVTFHKAGTVTIKVRSEEFAGVMDSMTVTVVCKTNTEQTTKGCASVTTGGLWALIIAGVFVSVTIAKGRRK